MASTTFSVPPASLHDQDHTSSPHQPSDQHRPSTGSIDSTHLSPIFSRVDSESRSPSVNHLETPAGSNYHSSDFSDIDEDPFFGADFGAVDGATPSFLDDSTIDINTSLFPSDTPHESAQTQHDEVNTYPLTPEQTASIHTTSPGSETRGALRLSITSQMTASISPQELQKPFTSDPIFVQPSQFTPSQSSSCRSSEDGLAPATINMVAQSPRVTVSFWGKDSDTLIHTAERSFEDSPTTVRGGFQSAGDLISADGDVHPAPRDSMGIWQPDPSSGQAGLGPDSRPSDELPTSINEMAAHREVKEKNEVVGEWLSDKLNDLTIAPTENPADAINNADQKRDVDDNLPLGNETRNQYQPGQTYFSSNGGPMNETDYHIMISNRNWADAPLDPLIKTGPERYQPESSQAAIERFERMCLDTDSIFSRAATWGTRRRSLPSLFDVDMREGSISGNIFKKFSISRPDRGADRGSKQGSQQSSLLRDLRGLMRRPSAASLLKRNRDANDEESNPGSDSRGSQDSKRDSISLLAPPNRNGSWGKKPMPSINTALGMMGRNAASIGTTHSRSGSISATPVTSPKSPFGGLSVKNSLRRPRSKSELPKGASNLQTDSHPSLVSMWRQTGGPPVANLAKPSNNTAMDGEEDDDDDDEIGDDSEMKGSANIIDTITPDLAGFQQHVLELNPGLATTNNYLVDRIAHQQLTRYKQLLKAKVNHMGLGANCSSGRFCIALGGSASILEQGGDIRDVDPLSSAIDDEDGTPTEGKITHESFPQDIPMPPTARLPAEFECQLCYQSKKFQKPSDWTKHVHEDVQPFTCTWDKCREPKIFKRKADWVRHENEGHRHLEWWTCDVEGCHHQCFRRDNFLQHLVREHKYPEPKVKTKAAIKKSGGGDPTWLKVEQCHLETRATPQEEPCRFCGRVFPTWKKLTVHLAKHMESISLPVLRLVAAKAKELSADTVISPVQDPPPRPMLPTPVTQTAPMVQFPAPVQPHVSPNPSQGAFQQGQMVYPVMPTEQQYQPGYFQNPYGNIGQNLPPTPMVHPMNQNYNHTGGMPVTTAPFVQSSGQYMVIQNSGLEQFPQMNALGLQNQNIPLGQMAYDGNGMMDPSSGNGSPFSGHESMSPYTHSPNQNAHHGENLWGGDKHMYG